MEGHSSVPNTGVGDNIEESHSRINYRAQFRAQSDLGSSSRGAHFDDSRTTDREHTPDSRTTDREHTPVPGRASQSRTEPLKADNSRDDHERSYTASSSSGQHQGEHSSKLGSKINMPLIPKSSLHEEVVDQAHENREKLSNQHDLVQAIIAGSYDGDHTTSTKEPQRHHEPQSQLAAGMRAINSSSTVPDSHSDSQVSRAKGILTPTSITAPTPSMSSVSTFTVKAHRVGDRKLEVQSIVGFTQGCFILVEPGSENQETRVVTGFGSLHIDKPLQFDHPEHTVIRVAVPGSESVVVSTAGPSTTTASSSGRDRPTSPQEKNKPDPSGVDIGRQHERIEDVSRHEDSHQMDTRKTSLDPGAHSEPDQIDLKNGSHIETGDSRPSFSSSPTRTRSPIPLQRLSRDAHTSLSALDRYSTYGQRSQSRSPSPSRTHPQPTKRTFSNHLGSSNNQFYSNSTEDITTGLRASRDSRVVKNDFSDPFQDDTDEISQMCERRLVAELSRHPSPHDALRSLIHRAVKIATRVRPPIGSSGSGSGTGKDAGKEKIGPSVSYGFLSVSELADVINSVGVHMSPRELEALALGFASDAHGGINCSEFCETIQELVFNAIPGSSVENSRGQHSTSQSQSQSQFSLTGSPSKKTGDRTHVRPDARLDGQVMKSDQVDKEFTRLLYEIASSILTHDRTAVLGMALDLFCIVIIALLVSYLLHCLYRIYCSTCIVYIVSLVSYLLYQRSNAVLFVYMIKFEMITVHLWFHLFITSCAQNRHTHKHT